MEINTLEVTEQPEGLGFISMRKLVNQTLKKSFGTMLSPDAIPSGFKEMDKHLGGFQKGHLYTVAVKPGMGKTAFLLSIANNMAIKDEYAAAIFSYERSNIKMTNRIIESETGMSLDKLQTGDFKASEKDHMLSLLSNIAKAKIYIDDTQDLTADQLSLKVKQLKDRHRVDIVIIDYLELIRPADSTTHDRAAQLSAILKALKTIAVERDVPVLLFSQSAWPVNGFAKKGAPSVAALPQFLHEYADALMLLHRNDAFAVPEATGKSPVELRVVKKGKKEMEKVLPLNFIGSIAKFTDYA